jgi:glycosyltransferase involved in cell wall biosynthesis
MALNFSGAINPLSFGNVSIGFLYGLFKLGVKVNIFPISNQVDISAFDKLPDDFKDWLSESLNGSLLNYKSTDPGFKIWHINSSQEKISDKQFLFTFNECDALTPVEANILNNQQVTFVSSPYNKEVFEKSGVKNVRFVPLAFDSLHYHRLEKRLIPQNVISFGLLGKWEKRKATQNVLKAWAKKYGNNPKYMLQAAVTNPFFSPEQNGQLRVQALEGKSYHNINFLPFVKTNSEYNQILNAIDIVLGMSKSEAFGLPEFHSVAIGKHAVVHNAAGYKAWANADNAVLVESTGKETVYDGVFFHPNQPFNQGSYFTWNEDEFITACEKAEKKYLENPVNEAGLKLQKEFTWEKSAREILDTVAQTEHFD